MGLFSRKTKKIDDEERELEEDGKESSNKKIFKKKDFKDLTSENKKSRREPKKPWGKFERLTVFMVLLLTAGVSVYLWAVSTGWEFPKLNFNEITLPQIFKEEIIIIENTP